MTQEGINIGLWNKVEKTNPSYTQEVKYGGRTFTAIDPQYQMKNATEQFGPFGQGFGLRDEVFKEVYLNDEGGTMLLIYTAILWYKVTQTAQEASFPVTSMTKVVYKSSGGQTIIDTDASKKVQTNALSKGLSRLGFNADIFLGKYEDEKYVMAMGEEFADENIDIDTVGLLIGATTTHQELKKVWEDLTPKERGNKSIEAMKDKRKEELGTKKDTDTK